jgi:hypothetical protein
MSSPRLAQTRADFPSQGPPSQRFGVVLLRFSIGPLNYAATLFLQHKVPDAMRELTRDSLRGALSLGVAEVAKRAGVSPRDVEQLLPQSELSASLAEVELRQQQAVHAWTMHGGKQGLLGGVGELTVDARTPDAATCVRRIADKLWRDKVLAEPLRAFADSLARWENTVDACRRALEAAGGLEQVYLRRRRRRVAAVLAACALVLGLTAFLGARWSARREIERLLAQPDPCSLEGASVESRSFVTLEQAARARELVAACVDGRARAAAEAETRAAAERARREKEAADAKRTAECDGLAARVAKGPLGEADRALAADAADLLTRVALRELTAADYGPAEPVLPCADRPKAQQAIESALGDALVASDRWVSAEHPSSRTARLVAERLAKLPARDLALYGSIADTRAKEAIKSGRAARLASARARCSMAKALRLPPRAGCHDLAGFPR